MTNQQQSGQEGFTVWITGLPFTGKKETGTILAQRLEHLGYKTEVLIGGEIRRQYDKKLGFTKEEIYKNVRRIAFECKLLSENGVIAIAVTVSPFRELRDECRQMIGRFIEVYHRAPLQVMKERDKKGLFKKAEEGLLQNVAGISIPYEESERPELIIEADQIGPAESANRILIKLQELNLLEGADRSVLLKQEENNIRRILKETWSK